MIKVILFNLWHIGDTHFSQGFVRVLCQSNPHIKFTYHVLYNTYVYKDIKNLTREEADIDKLQTISCGSTQLAYKLGAGIYAINTWIAAWFPFSKPRGINIECNVFGMFEMTPIILERVQLDTGLHLDFHARQPYDLIPVLPTCCIDAFLSWGEQLSPCPPCLVYQNFLGKSGQKLPIKSMEEHDGVLKTLSSRFTSVMFLVPTTRSSLLGIPNIVFMDEQFGLHNDKTCENVYKLATISHHCDYVVGFDIGACFTCLNTGMARSKSKLICLGATSFYFDQMKPAFESITTIDHRPKMFICNNMHDVIKTLEQVLSHS